MNIFVEKFLKKMSSKLEKEILTVEPEVKKILNQYHWPGNIRELENILEYAINMVEGDILLKEHLPSFLKNSQNTKIENEDSIFSLAEVERRAIEKAIKKFAGNMTKAAKALGIARNTLYEKIRKYKLKD